MYIIASSTSRNRFLPNNLRGNLKKEFIYIESKEDLTYSNLKKINPRYIFFPHWSYIIPSEIYESFECVIFHMTDVPFGRGGSPLQNLIIRGIYETKLTALKCVQELDAGPVYMKVPLSLYGSAEEIYLRAAKKIEEMIVSIVINEPLPVEQSGEAVTFSRRKPDQGDISKLQTLEEIFDYIRMLDAEGYPYAFLETDHFKFEFSRASLKQESIIADVKITIKKEKADE